MAPERQQVILRHVVEDYVKDAAPISSESLARKRDVGVSPATVRSEVAALEEQGYISRPHASAGSVPEDDGYRLYVETFVQRDGARVSSRLRSDVRSRFADVRDDVDRWGSVASALLAQMVGNLGVATFPKTSVARVKHLEIVPVQRFIALLIVVLEQAKLRKQLLRFDEPVDGADLESMSLRLRGRVVGRTQDEIAGQPMELTDHERRAVDATIVMLREEDASDNADHYVSGLRNLLDQPEFVDHERMRRIVHGVEDGSLIEAALDEAPMGRVVKVVIGREHRGAALRPLSVVLCRYGVPGRALGTVGVLGPTRLRYHRAVSGVRVVSAIMNRMVASVYGQAQP